MIDVKADIIEYMPHMFRIQVHGYLYGEHASYKQVKFPADWWQAFKARWFPAWALRRWPVVHTTVRFEAKAIYPHFRPSLHREEYQLLLSESTFTPPHRTP